MKDGIVTKDPDKELQPLKNIIEDKNNDNQNTNNNDNKELPKQNPTYELIKTNPARDKENYVDIRNDYIWEGFPMSERFWYSFVVRQNVVVIIKMEKF